MQYQILEGWVVNFGDGGDLFVIVYSNAEVCKYISVFCILVALIEMISCARELCSRGIVHLCQETVPTSLLPGQFSKVKYCYDRLADVRASQACSTSHTDDNIVSNALPLCVAQCYARLVQMYQQHNSTFSSQGKAYVRHAMEHTRPCTTTRSENFDNPSFEPRQFNS